VKSCTTRFRGNVLDTAAKSVATSPMTLFAADECIICHLWNTRQQQQKFTGSEIKIGYARERLT
jgi:hypothetical protein